jgi:6-phosphogluconolactonase
MRLLVGADPSAAARLAADEIVRVCSDAVARSGHCLVALSGGETPWLMLADLRGRPLDWSRLHVAQVDERIAPAGDPRRNLARLEAILVRDGPLPRDHLWSMPVEQAPAERAAADYQETLEARFGAPLRFDLVQLGLGPDGHTASLVPGDPVLEVSDRDVATTGVYQGLPRMTLTYPALARSRARLWLVTGAAKAARLAELIAGTGDAPASRVERAESTVIADIASAGLLAHDPGTPG